MLSASRSLSLRTCTHCESVCTPAHNMWGARIDASRCRFRQLAFSRKAAARQQPEARALNRHQHQKKVRTHMGCECCERARAFGWRNYDYCLFHSRLAGNLWADNCVRECVRESVHGTATTVWTQCVRTWENGKIKRITKRSVNTKHTLA